MLGVLAGLGLMVKFNIGIEALALFGAVLIYVWGREWKAGGRPRLAALVPVGVLATAAVGLYAASTGQIREFGSFLYYSWQIATSYSEGMGVRGPEWQLLIGLCAAARLLSYFG